MLDEDREGLLVHRHLTRSTQAWEAMGRDPASCTAECGSWPRSTGPMVAPTSLQTNGVPRGEQRCAGARVERCAASRPSSADHARRRCRPARRSRSWRGRWRSFTQPRAPRQYRGSGGRLSSQSRGGRAKHPDLALLLALEAGRVDVGRLPWRAPGGPQHGSRIRAWLQGFDSPVEDRVQSGRQAPGAIRELVKEQGQHNNVLLQEPAVRTERGRL